VKQPCTTHVVGSWKQTTLPIVPKAPISEINNEHTELITVVGASFSENTTRTDCGSSRKAAGNASKEDYKKKFVHIPSPLV